MGFFDFLRSVARYERDDYGIGRLNQRHRKLIAPIAADLAGARVLDLAAHDGRWSYAFAAAGAAEVVGIEGRQHLIDRFAEFPQDEAAARVTLRCGDIFEGMEADLAAGARYDVVGVLGIFYHIMDHFRLLQLVTRFQPRLVLLDSEFSQRPGQVIDLVREDPGKDLNALAQVAGQEKALIGIPSLARSRRWRMYWATGPTGWIGPMCGRTSGVLWPITSAPRASAAPPVSCVRRHENAPLRGRFRQP